MKDKSLSVLIKEADEVFSKYIRQRDSVGGLVRCFVCKKWIRLSESQCMHFIGRSHMRTRYDEANCYSGCIECNQFDLKHLIRFEERLIEEYGYNFFNGLNALRHITWKFTRSELLELIQEYKTKLKQLKS